MISYVSVKSFGDLVIAMTSLREVEPSEKKRVGVLAGHHLSGLAEVLEFPVDLVVLDGLDAVVPSLFNLRQDGFARGLRSAVSLRCSIQGATTASHRLVFDSRGPREQWLGLGRRVDYLPFAPNIYQAYSASLRDLALAGPTAAPVSAPVPMAVTGVFPSSRVRAKNLRVDVIAAIVDRVEALGDPVAVYILEGERPDIEQSGLPHVVVRKSFSELLRVVSSCRRVISADSLPAHLAEHALRPVFVAKPIPNPYWLPLTAYTCGRWSIFNELKGAQRSELERFFADT